MDINEIVQYLQQFLAPEALRQVLAFVLLLIVAYIPAKLIEWMVGRILRRWLGTLSWLAGALEILKSVLFPLLAWGLGSVALYVFELQDWATEILAWLLPLLPVWMIYRLAKTAVYLALPADRARRLHVRLVLPLTLVLVALHIAGVLTNFWDYRAEILQAAILILIFFVSKIPVEPLRRQLDKVQIRILGSSIPEVLPVARHAIPILMWALQPLMAWILGMAVIALYDVLGLDSAFSVWAVSFFLLWFVYEVVQAFLALYLAPANAKRTVRILQVVVLVIAALHSIDRLDVVWEWGVWQIGENAWVEFGGLVTGLVVIALTILLSRSTRVFLQQRLPRTGVNPSLAQSLTTFSGYLVVFVGVMIALNLMHIPLTSLTIILGGLSVGIGFSLQDILSNFIAGIVLMFEGAIVPGDVLEVDQTTGVVTEVGIRSMRMRTYDNVEIVVPNSRFLTQEVRNYSSRDRGVRVRIPVGVTSDADPRQAEAAILQGAHHPDILDDPPPSVFYVAFTSDNHDFELCVWTDDATKIPRIRSDLRYNVWDALVAQDIGLPLQALDLYVKSVPPEMATDGPG
jgi:small-conductance mechanosensitive channel